MERLLLLWRPPDMTISMSKFASAQKVLRGYYWSACSTLAGHLLRSLWTNSVGVRYGGVSPSKKLVMMNNLEDFCKSYDMMYITVFAPEDSRIGAVIIIYGSSWFIDISHP